MSIMGMWPPRDLWRWVTPMEPVREPWVCPRCGRVWHGENQCKPRNQKVDLKEKPKYENNS